MFFDRRLWARAGYLVSLSRAMTSSAQHSSRDRLSIQAHFHALIKSRAAELFVYDLPELPSLESMFESTSDSEWLAVPGMYGGFKYWIDRDAPGFSLIAESWSRIVGGSGRRHEISAEGSLLVEKGFV